MTEGSIPGYEMGRPAYFEVIFALMALQFAAVGVDWAAVETGLGGRFDATNTLVSDVALITNISLEHTHVLGRTIRSIAGEKAAIIKSGTSAITGSDEPDAIAVIQSRADEVGAPLVRVGRDISWEIVSRNLVSQQLKLESRFIGLQIELPSAAPYQARNAAAAYAAVLALRSRGVEITDEQIRKGFSVLELPGRFEIVSSDPLVILDGAHNPSAAHELREALDTLLPDTRVTLLFGAMGDKDVAAMADELVPRWWRTIITSVPGSHRGSSTGAVAEAFQRHGGDVMLVDSPDAALEIALGQSRSGDAVVVSGSMYLVGHVREALRRTAAIS
jgi:dihydrofolate synthase/folylpolyglutamate synthase